MLLFPSEELSTFPGQVQIFPDPAMTLAAIDRLVHHATIFEMNVESYRRRVALERKRGPGRPPTRATSKTSMIDAPRQSTLHNTLARDNQRDHHHPAAAPDSHPDRRPALIQIVALHEPACGPVAS